MAINSNAPLHHRSQVAHVPKPQHEHSQAPTSTFLALTFPKYPKPTIFVPKDQVSMFPPLCIVCHPKPHVPSPHLHVPNPFLGFRDTLNTYLLCIFGTHMHHQCFSAHTCSKTHSIGLYLAPINLYVAFLYPDFFVCLFACFSTNVYEFLIIK